MTTDTKKVTSEHFYRDMLELQTNLCAEYAKEVGRLRIENAELRKTIAAFPSDASALQDRVTMLEGLCVRNPAPHAAQPMVPTGPIVTMQVRS